MLLHLTHHHTTRQLKFAITAAHRCSITVSSSFHSAQRAPATSSRAISSHASVNKNAASSSSSASVSIRSFSSSTSASSSSDAPSSTVSQLVTSLVDGSRLSLSRAITLVESVHPHHRTQAIELFTLLQSQAIQSRIAQAREKRRQEWSKRSEERWKNSDAKEKERQSIITQPRSIRIGISGPPGVGKSTFIEAFGVYLMSLGHRLAVLTIDPSSTVSGGSVLGDRTRMNELSKYGGYGDEHSEGDATSDSSSSSSSSSTANPTGVCYIRPSPSRCVLGGVAAATADTMLLCEASGYDIIIVESVGVGQSEVSICDMVDMSLLLVQPSSGDELQGMKKGIVELMDYVIVNKSDGSLIDHARQTKIEYMHAIQLNTHRRKATDWKTKVKLFSSIAKVDVEATAVAASSKSSPSANTSVAPISPSESVWRDIIEFDEWSHGKHGDFAQRRHRQLVALMRSAAQVELQQRLQHTLSQLPTYQRIMAEQQTNTPTKTMPALDKKAASSSSFLVPRVIAAHLCDEWIEREKRR